MNLRAFLRSKRGVSLVQILIASGIMSLVSLGIVQMIIQSRINNRRLALMRNLAEQKIRIETMFRDQSAFNQTIINNTGGMWASLKVNNPVTEATPSSTDVVGFTLYNGAGIAQNFSIGPTTSGTGLNGLTERLVPCNTFSNNTDSGNDNCPMSYRMMYVADCPESGEVTCSEPNIKMVARLVYNPAKNGTLIRWKTLIDQAQGYSLDTQQRDGKFDAVVIRTPSSVAKSFTMRAYVAAGVNGTANCPSTTSTACGACASGVGSCNIAGPDPGAVHPKVTSLVVVSNAFGLLDATSNWTVSGTWRFGKTGNYTCTASGFAYGTRSTIVQFKDAGALATSLGSSTIFAVPGSEVPTKLVSNFYVNDTTRNYSLYVWCPQSPGATVCDLGWAKGNPTTKTNVLEISCTRNDDAF